MGGGIALNFVPFFFLYQVNTQVHFVHLVSIKKDFGFQECTVLEASKFVPFCLYRLTKTENSLLYAYCIYTLTTLLVLVI
jgi:hypothetical protein